jgi:hypothetical protein
VDCIVKLFQVVLNIDIFSKSFDWFMQHSFHFQGNAVISHNSPNMNWANI